MSDLLTDHDWLRIVRSSRLALLLDLDGTLVPFAARPEDATLDARVRDLLRELSTVGVTTCPCTRTSPASARSRP